MTHDGDVKLGDFGISKQLNGENIMRYSIYMNYSIYKAPELQKSEPYTIYVRYNGPWMHHLCFFFTIKVYDGNNFSIENGPPCDCMPFTCKLYQWIGFFYKNILRYNNTFFRK